MVRHIDIQSVGDPNGWIGMYVVIGNPAPWLEDITLIPGECFKILGLAKSFGIVLPLFRCRKGDSSFLLYQHEVAYVSETFEGINKNNTSSTSRSINIGEE